MLLICDCGSTKAEWAVLDGNNVVKRFITNGFNPNFTDNATMNRIISETKDIIDNQDVRKICFYGSGCGGDSNILRVKLIFSRIFSKAEVEIYPDTLAACHALFGNNSGVACILGTGSNASVYDGEVITQSAASLGFMIGDEGSGCHIGKRIVHDYFVGIMPEDLRVRFDEKYHLDRETFLKRVYQGEQPSRYLSEFARFAGENIENQYVIKLVEKCFEEFIETSFRPTAVSGGTTFNDYARNDVGFVGSIAFAFKEILLKVLENHHIKCSKILKNPMDGLVEYYKSLIV